mgnify:CR=1 FL=1
MERHADQSRMSTLPIEAGNFESIFFEQPPVAAQAATTTEAAEHLSATRSDTSPFLPHPQLGHPQLGPTEAADIADTLQNGESCFRQQQARTRPPTSPTSADVRQPLPAQSITPDVGGSPFSRIGFSFAPSAAPSNDVAVRSAQRADGGRADLPVVQQRACTAASTSTAQLSAGFMSATHLLSSNDNTRIGFSFAPSAAPLSGDAVRGAAHRADGWAGLPVVQPHASSSASAPAAQLGADFVAHALAIRRYGCTLQAGFYTGRSTTRR